MYCSNCGIEIQNTNASYCSNCGTKIGEIKVVKVVQEVESHANSQIENPKKQGTVYIVIGWVSFAISLLFIPLIFGAVAFIMGFLTYKTRSEIQGVVLMVCSIVGTIFGMLLGMILWSI